jgi:hypothetical protein
VRPYLTGGAVLSRRLGGAQAPFGTAQLAPEIGGTVEPGDKVSGVSPRTVFRSLAHRHASPSEGMPSPTAPKDTE